MIGSRMRPVETKTAKNKDNAGKRENWQLSPHLTKVLVAAVVASDNRAGRVVANDQRVSPIKYLGCNCDAVLNRPASSRGSNQAETHPRNLAIESTDRRARLLTSACANYRRSVVSSAVTRFHSRPGAIPRVQFWGTLPLYPQARSIP